MSFFNVAANNVTTAIAPERHGKIRMVDIEFAINDGDGYILALETA